MPSPPRQNRALILAREQFGWSRAELARRVAGASRGQIALESADRAIKRIESGQVQNPTEYYQGLICEVLRTSAVELFGAPRAESPSSAPSALTVTCRKYIPVTITPSLAARVAEHPGMEAHEIDGSRCSRMVMPWPHDDHARLTVTVFGFGVLVAELRQTVAFANLADLAVWRHTSYEVDRPHIGDLLRRTWPAISASPEYVLGTWWLARSAWAGQDLDTAVRVMSTPSALLRRQGDPSVEQLRAGAEVAERAVWQQGFEAGPDLVDFGLSGVSVGYASWSGVAYAPLAVDRALHPEELGDVETLYQALWSLCHTVCETAEVGHDPQVDPSYGWRWLRGVSSRIARPRPTETRQVRSMRDAVLETSQLRTMLPATIDLLRDASPARTL
ncbi:helix-turn-helix transcriptional regulator [Nocardiopsis sp. NRRL B-16309]|uniref:helix-turn-helix transcriptional regulator n=1 Tax=Nocardiopsis sp. NRRL B-16309 TaxID=1519494 RepID=UPI0006ADE6F9|nr:helix-turn-helix domain-containing protein [Nocardiopsis sp. NRRL B-16309]